MPVKKVKLKEKLLIVQVAGLGLDTFTNSPTLREALHGLESHRLTPPLPAVTCTAQATFRTATDPAQHGIVANGWLDRSWRKTTFWEQSSRLLSGERIWKGLRRRGGRVAMLFWQQSLGEAADLIVSPAPIHKHNGGMVDALYSRPHGFAPAATGIIGRKFRLMNYWGPLAHPRGSRWIAEMTAITLSGQIEPAPDLCLTYLPCLDYDFLRYGPDHRKSRMALEWLAQDLKMLHKVCQHNGYRILIWGDYAIEHSTGAAVYPNRLLREAGFLDTRIVDGRHYVDLHTSRAFAAVDHQVAHVYVPDPNDRRQVKRLLSKIGEVKLTADIPELAHANSGELFFTAPPHRWVAYPWWHGKRQAPDFASHVDIHSKPGFDTCELFFGWPPRTISMNSSRVGGVHGREGMESCWISDLPLKPSSSRLSDLGAAVRDYLESFS